MAGECKFYVFREGRRGVQGEQLLAGLRGSLRRAEDENGWVDALLRSGELECGLEDAGDPLAGSVADLTDVLANKLASWSFRPKAELMAKLPLRLARALNISTPEGFAYYALHPRQYAEVAERLGNSDAAMVIGIRSIGTTLSAMTAAGLRRRGWQVQRLTVRPIGHPFDRHVEWTTEQRQTITAATARNAQFVVVDEGPGLSGSSFLSVAEALCSAGVPKQQIVLVPSHVPHLPALRAHNAAARWKQFRCVNLAPARFPAGEWIGGGAWRQRFSGDERRWPGVWAPMERAKFLAPEVFWKFEGLGGYGLRPRLVARTLAEAGFGAKIAGDELGYIGYERLTGRPASSADLKRERLQRMAAYCAFRAREISCPVDERARQDLEAIVRVNYERAWGAALPHARRQLEVVRPTVCDAKMAPHEWLLTEEGRMLKLDATSHGDDHFFPGPCDIAWDVAGAIVEWDMDRATSDAFLREYAAQAQDDISGRIGNYLIAYAVFRCAWTHMAAAAMSGTPEETRFTREAQRYRAYVERMIAPPRAMPAERAS